MYIPVFRHTDETRSLIEADVQYPMSTCDQFKVKFYRIDNIGEYYDPMDQLSYATIVSGCNEYISPLTQEEAIERWEQYEKTH